MQNFSTLPSWLGAFASLGLLPLFCAAFLGAIIFVPRTPTFLAGGAIFGIAAAPVVLFGATLGGWIGFMISRYLLREHVRRYVDRRPRLKRVVGAIDKEGLRVLALLRFWGPIPSSVQNYAFGLTRVRMLDFIGVSLLFGAPQALVYTYLGEATRDFWRGQVHATLAWGGLAALVCLGVCSALIGRRIAAELQVIAPS